MPVASWGPDAGARRTHGASSPAFLLQRIPGAPMKDPSLTSPSRRQRSVRRLRFLPVPCALALGLAAADDALAVPFFVDSSGTFSDSWDFPTGALPTAVGATKLYTARAVAGAKADGTTGP